MIERTRYEKYTKYTKDGMPHRANGPAYEWWDGDWSWLLNCDFHRYYGPQNYSNEWWIHGRQVK
jgi:hypothetical protein